MSIYTNNLQSLTERYEKLRRYLEQYAEADEQDAAGEISFGVSDIGEKQVLYAVKPGKEGDEPVQLDSLYDSEALLKLWCADRKTLAGYQTKCIFCGFGNGMYVRKALETADDTGRVLVYEPSAKLFSFVMRHFELADLLADERLTVIVEDYYVCSFEDEIYRLVSYSDLNHLIYQAYPNYDRLFPKETKETDHIIQIMYNSIRATQSVLDRYGERYTLNGLYNIRHFFKGRSMTDFFQKMDKDIPVIIVASGPSLNKNIDKLKAAKGKCLLVGVDSSVPALVTHGIQPDIFVSVDAKKHQNHFKLQEVTEIPVICELSSNYQALNVLRNKKFFINDMNNYVNRFFVNKGILFPVFTTGGSVANTACSIFISMGFHTIILAGQDLAYTGDKTHAAGTILDWEEVGQRKEGLTWIEGYYGEKVKTSYEFQLYLKWFEEEIEKNPDVSFINATEGGAMIHGARNMTLQSAIADYCTKEVNAEQVLDSIEEILPPQQKAEFAEYILQIEPSLKELRHLASRAARNYQKMKELAYQNKYRSREWMRMFQEAKQIGDRLEKEDVMIYVQNMVQSETSQIMQNVNEVMADAKEEIIATCDIGEAYLRKIIAGMEQVLESDALKSAIDAAGEVLRKFK